MRISHNDAVCTAVPVQDRRTVEGLARSPWARWKHGLYSAAARAEQKRVRELLSQSRELLRPQGSWVHLAVWLRVLGFRRLRSLGSRESGMEAAKAARPQRPPAPVWETDRLSPLLQFASEGETNIDELIWDCEAVEQGT